MVGYFHSFDAVSKRRIDLFGLNYFRCTNDLCGLRDRCSEFEVRNKADAMVEQGMLQYGYKWILLDDCWADHSRDADGKLQPNPYQFPSGMKNLARYLHAKGLKLGLYTCVGTETCKKNRPGSYGNYELDAQTFADWGVDMVRRIYYLLNYLFFSFILTFFFFFVVAAGEG
jgi:hypothetical protein